MIRVLRGGVVGALLRLAALQRCRRGSALVEFAFVAPILILLSFGTFDLGRAVWFDVTLQHAAKEAARFASLRGSESISPVSESDVETYVHSRAAGIPSAGLVVNVSWLPDESSGSTVQVELTYQYEFFLQGWLPIGPLQLQGSASRIVL